MTESTQPNRIGEVVGGKYRIVRFLATGGMGVVYEAQHEVVKRRFAVKLLRVGLAERRDILTRFQREAEAAGALESENVAAAIDFGIARDGTPYIVMEYLVGESLAGLLGREGPLPVERAADLVIQACRGMQVAHAAGIVHRDLKPQNLFVCRREDGTDLVKVLDFGVAKLQAFEELNAATRTGTVMGTAAYMAPEQARGDKLIDLRADVYALGAILYELLSGQLPHPGDSHNAILHHISTQPAVPLQSVRAELPGGLTTVVGLALASQPTERPASAEAFGQALAPFAVRKVWPAPPLPDATPPQGERAVAGERTPALGPTPRQVTPSTARLSPAWGAPTPAAIPPPRGAARRIVFAGAALALGVILVGAGARVLRSRRQPGTPVPPAPVATAPVAMPPAPPEPVAAAPAAVKEPAPAPPVPVPEAAAAPARPAAGRRWTGGRAGRCTGPPRQAADRARHLRRTEPVQLRRLSTSPRGAGGAPGSTLKSLRHSS